MECIDNKKAYVYKLKDKIKALEEKNKVLEEENRDLRSSLIFTNGILKNFRIRLNKAEKEIKENERQ